jgi:uncharacterized protein (TIGR02145 family)
VCAVALCAAVVFQACNDDNPDGTETKQVALSAKPASFVQGGSTTFTVTCDGENVTSQATITETGSKSTIVGATWSSDTEGTYTFEATYDNVTSKPVVITVTKKDEPDEPDNPDNPDNPVEPVALDYTDNGRAAFFVADADLSTDIMNYDIAMNNCPTGWRLPTHNEALTLMTYRNSNEYKFNVASYWTSTISKEEAYAGWAMGYTVIPSATSTALATNLESKTLARCVKDAATGAVTYPYVVTTNLDGPIIVSRDNDGGVKLSSHWEGYTDELFVFHDIWTTTPAVSVGDTDDSISKKLQVANTDSGEMVAHNAKSCPEGWRVPTHAELRLIYVAGGGKPEIYDTNPASEYYNPPVVTTPLHGVDGFTPLADDNRYWAANINSGRGGQSSACWPFTASAREFIGSLTGPDTNHTRCVRDVE